MSWFCFCCEEEQEIGIISGQDTILPTRIASEPITTYFHNEIHHSKIPMSKQAVRFQENKLTFHELHHYSTIIAKRLKDILGDFINKNPDEEIVFALCLPPSEKLIVSMFAVLKIGAAICPLDPTSPAGILFDIVDKFCPVMIITDDEGPILGVRGKQNPFRRCKECRIISIDEIWRVIKMPDDDSLTEFKNDELRMDKLVEPLKMSADMTLMERPAFVFHTNGINKDPRGVRISHTTVMNRICWTWHHIPYCKEGVCCLNVPITQAESINQIFGPLLKGITLHIFTQEDSSDMRNFIHRLSQLRVTRINLTPNVLREFLQQCLIIGKDDSRYYLRYLRLINCKGGHMPIEIAQSFFELFEYDRKELCSLYGYTETSGDVICEKYRNFNEVKKKLYMGHVAIGQVIDNAKIYILKNTRQLAQENEDGQICIAGYPLAIGYVNKRARQDNYFLANPFENQEKYNKIYLTGDFGRQVKCKDGKYRLVILGREDSLIRHEGQEFLTDDIKGKLGETEYFSDSCILVYRRGITGQSILAFVISKPEYEGKLDEEQILKKLSVHLPKYMLPIVIILSKFPLLPNGRTDNHALIKIYQDQRDCDFQWARVKLKTVDILEAGKVLFQAMYKYCSISMEYASKNLDSSFYDIGGSISSTINVIEYLNLKGFPITIPEFVGATSIKSCMHLMDNRKTLFNYRASLKTENPDTSLEIPGIVQKIGLTATELTSSAYSTRSLVGSTQQKEVISLIAQYNTDELALDKCLLVRIEEYVSFLTYQWRSLISQGFSVGIFNNSTNSLVGASININFFTDIDTSKIPSHLQSIVEFIQEVKAHVFQDMETEAKYAEIMEVFYIGTLISLSPKETIRVTLILWNEILRKARAKKQKAIFTATTDQFTRDLLMKVYDFKLLADFVPNEWMDPEGDKPFHITPNTLSISCLYKPLLKNSDGGDEQQQQPTTGTGTNKNNYGLDQKPEQNQQHNKKNRTELILSGDKRKPKKIKIKRNNNKTLDEEPEYD